MTRLPPALVDPYDLLVEHKAPGFWGLRWRDGEVVSLTWITESRWHGTTDCTLPMVDLFGSHPAWTESLALLQMPNRVRETAQALGIATKSLLLEVLKADDEDEMVRLLEEVERRGLSRDDLRRQRRGQAKKPGQRRRPLSPRRQDLPAHPSRPSESCPLPGERGLPTRSRSPPLRLRKQRQSRNGPSDLRRQP